MNITLAIRTGADITINTPVQVDYGIDLWNGRVAFVTAEDAQFVMGHTGGLPTGELRTLCQEHGRNPVLDAALRWMAANTATCEDCTEWGVINAPGTFGDWFFVPALALEHAMPTQAVTHDGRRWTCEGPKGLIVAYTGSSFLLHQGRSPIAPDRWVDVESYGSPVQYPSSRRPDGRDAWSMTVLPSHPVVYADPAGQLHCADPAHYRADNAPA